MESKITNQIDEIITEIKDITGSLVTLNVNQADSLTQALIKTTVAKEKQNQKLATIDNLIYKLSEILSENL